MAAVNLAEEIEAFLLSDPVVRSLVADKAYQGEAPVTGVDFPYLVFTKEETSRRNTFKGGYSIDSVAVRFRLYAAQCGDAERLAGETKGRLLPHALYTPAPFWGTYGREIGRYSPGPDTTELDPQRAPLGLDGWVSSFPVVFQIARP